jgi:hypothetical protein
MPDSLAMIDLKGPVWAGGLLGAFVLVQDPATVTLTPHIDLSMGY